MATEGSSPFKITKQSGAAVLQYRFCKYDAAGKVIHATLAVDAPAGVSQDDTATAADMPVELAGAPALTKITAGAALAAGAKVIPGTAGKAIAAGVAGTNAWGVLTEASGADGDIVQCHLVHTVV
jgi:hypothetical protein